MSSIFSFDLHVNSDLTATKARVPVKITTLSFTRTLTGDAAFDIALRSDYPNVRGIICFVDNYTGFDPYVVAVTSNSQGSYVGLLNRGVTGTVAFKVTIIESA